MSPQRPQPSTLSWVCVPRADCCAHGSSTPACGCVTSCETLWSPAEPCNFFPLLSASREDPEGEGTLSRAASLWVLIRPNPVLWGAGRGMLAASLASSSTRSSRGIYKPRPQSWPPRPAPMQANCPVTRLLTPSQPRRVPVSRIDV